jgi:benzoate/toluate 1,2-dioxygenase reductase subunit
MSSMHPIRREPHHVEVTGRRWISEHVFEITLTRPEGFSFRAGQSIRVRCMETERAYCLVSSPEDPFLALCILHLPQGKVSSYLAAIEPGSVIEFTGPHGDFAFIPSTREKVFVATGIGIVPFVSMVRSGVRDFMMVHGVSSPQELYYEDFFEKNGVKFVQCVPQASFQEGGKQSPFPGSVTDYLARELPRGEYDFYLSGDEAMVLDVYSVVDELFLGSRVYSEIFFSRSMGQWQNRKPPVAAEGSGPTGRVR